MTDAGGRIPQPKDEREVAHMGNLIIATLFGAIFLGVLIGLGACKAADVIGDETFPHPELWKNFCRTQDDPNMAKCRENNEHNRKFDNIQIWVGLGVFLGVVGLVMLGQLATPAGQKQLADQYAKDIAEKREGESDDG